MGPLDFRSRCAPLLAISKAATWASGLTFGLLDIAAAVLLLWCWWELRARTSLVDLRTTLRRQVLLTNLTSIVFAFAMSLVLPQILQLPVATGHGLGQSLFVTGLVLVPSGLVMLAIAPVSARITAARGPKTTLMLGAVVVAAGYGVGAVLMSSAVAGSILAQLTVQFGPTVVPAEGAFCLVMALGCATSLAALGIAAFIPGRR